MVLGKPCLGPDDGLEIYCTIAKDYTKGYT
jgi:hypothetical protein